MKRLAPLALSRFPRIPKVCFRLLQARGAGIVTVGRSHYSVKVVNQVNSAADFQNLNCECVWYEAISVNSRLLKAGA
jgi:hypothetical protein